MIRRVPLLLSIISATLAALFLFAGFTQRASAQRLTIPTQTRTAGNPKISSAIQDLMAQGLARAGFRQGRVDIDEQGELRVYVEAAGDPQSLAADLRRLGATIELVNQELGIVQAKVPVTRLEEAADLDATRFIRLPDIGVINAGSVISQGDAALRADDLRAEGFDGTSIKIGVISDGIFGLAASQASGNLPPMVTTMSFRADGDITAGLDPGTKGSEGTAMLEIVHDLAPGAQLFFANFLTSLEFIAAQDWLANTAGGSGVDVLVDDIAFFDVGPFDGSSAVSLNATATLSEGVKAYVTSVGNQALRHYEADFVDSNPPVEGGFHDFSGSGAGADEALELGTLLNGQSISAFLQWNDPFGASGNNYDLRLVELDAGGNFVGFLPAIGGTEVQDGDDDPLEEPTYTNTTGGPLFIGLGIQKVNSTDANRHLDLFVFAPQPGNCTSALEYNTLSSSVPNVADAVNIISVGAVFHAAGPSSFNGTFNTPECFSSRGPTNDNRLKPEVVATDGVSTSVNNAGGNFTTFFGSSAAAPHVAAIAALLLDIKPALTAAELRAALMDSATDLGAAGDDNIFGAGRVDAINAAAELNAAAPVANFMAFVSGLTAMFNATSSLPRAGGDTIVSYSWNFGDGTTGSGATVSHTYAAPGDYTVSLTVTDDGIPPLSNTTQMVITVTGILPPVNAPALNIWGTLALALVLLVLMAFTLQLGRRRRR